MIKTDEQYMLLALKQAQKAFSIGEVPVGSIIVFSGFNNRKKYNNYYDLKEGCIIGRGYNKRNTNKTVISHSEIIAMIKANKKLKDWRLECCTMYVTLQPCDMCMSALIQSRIKRIVIGTTSYKNYRQIIDIDNLKKIFNIDIKVGVLKNECEFILKKFFKSIRNKNDF